VLEIALGLGLGILIVRSRMPFVLRAGDSTAFDFRGRDGPGTGVGYLAIACRSGRGCPTSNGLLQRSDFEESTPVLVHGLQPADGLPYVELSTVTGLERRLRRIERRRRKIGLHRVTRHSSDTTTRWGANLVAGGGDGLLMYVCLHKLEVSDS